MAKIIDTSYAKTYAITIHDLNNRGLLEFYYYKGDLINNDKICAQYYGKVIDTNKRKKSLLQTCFIFDENSFCNFVNKLEEFVQSNSQNKLTYISYRSRENTPTLRLEKLSNREYQISRAWTVYDSMDKKSNWSVIVTDIQAKRLVEHLKIMKIKIFS